MKNCLTTFWFICLIGTIAYICSQALDEIHAESLRKQNLKLMKEYSYLLLGGDDPVMLDAYEGILYHTDIVVDEDFRSITVFSDGADCKHGTDDDVNITTIDYNKTRLAAKWLGQHTKEAVKGFKDGLLERSRFGGKE